nr:MAG TPA: hypothetical protein [Caudoviricetes sp.]
MGRSKDLSIFFLKIFFEPIYKLVLESYNDIINKPSTN